MVVVTSVELHVPGNIRRLHCGVKVFKTVCLKFTPVKLPTGMRFKLTRILVLFAVDVAFE